VIAIREATPADARAMAELRWEFRSARAPNTESRDAFLARCEEWMRAEIERGRWRAWVADADGAIVGQLWMQLIDKIPNPTAELERHAYISNVYVTPRARGGIGARLVNAALDAASLAGVDSVVLWPTDRSRSLYMRCGFRVTGGVLELKCAGRQPAG
jgi:GNAT superfamily N-acetyltransferase